VRACRLLLVTIACGCGASTQSAIPKTTVEPAPSASTPTDDGDRSVCVLVPPVASSASLVGLEFADPFAGLAGGWTAESESTLGSQGFTLVVARQGQDLALLVVRTIADDPLRYRVLGTRTLGQPCKGFVIETSCVVDRKPDPWTFSLMDRRFVCGGHDRSHPAHAWRARPDGSLEGLATTRVTCGTFSCEGP